MSLTNMKRNLAVALICSLIMTGIMPAHAQTGEAYSDLILDEDEGFYEDDDDDNEDVNDTATPSNAAKASPSNQAAPRMAEPATPSQALVAAVKSFNREVTFVDREGNPVPEGADPEIPDTGKSFPYLSQREGRTKGKIDLEAYGYEEAEYFLSGNANVYDIEKNGRLATRSNANYVNRVIVFRPKDAGDFNGAVFVDILNASSKVDVPDIWRRSYDYFMSHGYVYVGITSKSVNVDALKRFDPSRYRALNWNDNGGKTENGLFWDMLGQLGVLLKSDASPLLYGDETGGETYTYLMGQSQSGWYVNTFNNHFSGANYVAEDLDDVEDVADIPGDTHIFDGFLNVVGGMMDAPIANKQTAPSAMFRPVKESEVPFILLVGENDYNPAPVREDSDEEGNLYRHYVIAGGAHSNKIFLPDPLDEIQLRAGRPAGDFPSYVMDPETGRPNTRSDMNMDVFVNAALENMHRWVSEDIPAPRGPSRDMIEGSMSGIAYSPARDDYGNMATGILSPQLTVPVASYYGGANGGFNTDGGSMVYLDDAAISGLYKDRDDYLEQFETALEDAIEARWILESDRELMMQIAQEEPVFGHPGPDDGEIEASMQAIPAARQISAQDSGSWLDTEYLIEGNAHMYGVLRDNIIYKRRMYALPYKNYTRVCIPRNFNGTIILDLIMDGEPEKDIAEYMESGKAYIGMTATPELAKSKGGSWEIPYQTGKPRMESGLVWDIISQTVTAIRHSDRLGDFGRRKLNIQLGADHSDADMACTYELVFGTFDAYGVNSLGAAGQGKPISLNSIDKTVPDVHAPAEEIHYGSRGSGGGSSRTGRKDEGDWICNEIGWWFRFPDGTWPANQWLQLPWNETLCWYFFNTEGYMATGWLEHESNRYYLHPVSDGTQGYMYTGWNLIDGKWYYFNEISDGTRGKLLTDTATPDGYTVGEDGARMP